MENGESGQTMQFSLQEDTREAAKKVGDEKSGEASSMEPSASLLLPFRELDGKNGDHQPDALKAPSPSAAAEYKSAPTLDINDLPKEEATIASDFGNESEAFGRGLGELKVVTPASAKEDVTDLNETPKLEFENESEQLSPIETTHVTHDFLQASEVKAVLLEKSAKSAKATLDVNETPDVYKSLQDSISSEVTEAQEVKGLHDVEMPAVAAVPATTMYLKVEEAGPEPFFLAENSESMEVLQAANELREIGQTSRQLEVMSKKEGRGDDVIDVNMGVEGESTQSGQKTELEREMELFEASEREEQARLLGPVRLDQHELQRGDQYVAKDLQNDKKRALESPLQERQRKQSRRIHGGDEKRKDEEDVCFICFDGGDLVLCDRRSCPKAYHLSCIGRDAAFFKKKGAWLCGWHFCSVCTKPGSFQCYTCPTSYCRSCIKDADFLLLRKRKGVCEECLPIVSMIERNETINAEGVEVDFDDQETYECLFKEYWVDLKNRLSLTMPEFDKDGKAVEGNNLLLQNGGSDTEDHSENDESGADSDKGLDESDHDDFQTLDGGRRKRNKRKGAAMASENAEEGIEADDDEEDNDVEEVTPRKIESWASKELLEFIVFMKEDPSKPHTRFAVNKLLWTYIKDHQLQDPRKKSQINCDERLQTIFGKKSVGQFEMFKHLQAHYPAKDSSGSRKKKEDSGGDEPIVDDDTIDADGVDERSGRTVVKDRRRGRRSTEEKFERPDSSDYAAITPRNIGLIYLRRALLEDLLDDPEFDSKVVDTFVRIRVPGMSSKSEMCYRLVLVTGTRVQAETYKAGRKTTNVVLEILNLQKKEDVTVDLVSNQDFNEEECQRLRQSIKCGFLKTLTVGQLEEKAIALREAKVNDWFENERQRLVNLRDRASEKGRKKELRECVEKLQELSSPAFRAAKLQARPEVTADPHMDPGYESDVSESMPNKGGYINSRGRISSSSAWDKGSGSAGGWDSLDDPTYLSRKGDWDQRSRPSTTWEETTSRSRDWGRGGYEPGRSSDTATVTRDLNYGVDNEKLYINDDRDRSRSWDKEWDRDLPRDQDRDRGDSYRWKSNGGRGHSDQWAGELAESKYSRGEYRSAVTPVFSQSKSDWGTTKREVGGSVTSLSATAAFGVSSQASREALEKESVWHYQDPSGTVQGPFTMEQLRKWNTTGLFPVDLQIWKMGQSRESSTLLTEALARSTKDRDSWPTTRARDLVGVSPTARVSDWRSEGGGISTWGGLQGASDSARYASESGGRGELSLSGRVGDWDSREPVDDHRGVSWGRGRSSSTYGTSPSTAGRGEDWGSSRSRVDKDGWGSPRKGGDLSSWGGDDSLKTSGRHSYGRSNSGRDWNDRDTTRSSRGPRGSKKDVPCRFYSKGHCKRGDACEFWHG